tara:strand:- start:2469 stop:3077 length:609 start_codon:yes stop_codon:yes gene_type:complete
MTLAATSKLEAINTMMSVIGEAPVNTLDAASQTADVIMAKTVLDEVSREVQAAGWNFNREYEVPLNPTTDNEIVLGSNIARIDVEPANAGTTLYIQRGSKIYNKTDRTYTITDTLKCTVTYLLEWDYLPQAARNYIMIRAARKFQDRVVGSGKHHDFTQMDEFQALVTLREAETDGGDFTIFDNYDVYKAIDRGNVINRISS